MNKKTHKVEEPATPYVASPRPAKTEVASGVRYAGATDVRKGNARLMQVHREVLQKLAR